MGVGIMGEAEEGAKAGRAAGRLRFEVRRGYMRPRSPGVGLLFPSLDRLSWEAQPEEQ